MKPIKTCLCRKGHCEHYQSDFDRFVILSIPKKLVDVMESTFTRKSQFDEFGKLVAKTMNDAYIMGIKAAKNQIVVALWDEIDVTDFENDEDKGYVRGLSEAQEIVKDIKVT